jgi:NitT/TauT family transport system permease protein
MLTDMRRASEAASESTLVGLDALELEAEPERSPLSRLWAAAWPKVAATVLALAVWQAVVWSGWKDSFALPGPAVVLPRFWQEVADGTFVQALGTTLQRAVTGFALAIVIGVVLGSLVARVRLLRTAFGSLITGVQTMPSVAWFPLAILLFQLSESAIMFVVVLGAAPSIANGLIAGTDQIPPLLLRVGRVLGARGLAAFRHIVLPASLPSFVAGLKQGWAFSWRSLMAGELLVIIADRPSIGFQLQVYRDLSDADGVIATMILILLIGIVVDALVFGTAERAIRRRWGLLENPA